MKYFIFLPFLLFLFACSEQPDKERIIGTWKYKEIYENDTLYLTSDPAKQKELIEEQIKNVSEEEIAKESANFVKLRTKQMKRECAGGYVFTDDFFFPFKDNGATLQPRKYKVDEKKKVFAWTMNGKKSDAKSSYKYTFEGDDLILKTQDLKIVLTRK